MASYPLVERQQHLSKKPQPVHWTAGGFAAAKKCKSSVLDLIHQVSRVS